MCCATNSGTRQRLGQAGVATLEFALIATAFFILLFGAMDLARYFATEQAVRTVASEAARHAIVDSTWTYSGAPTSGAAAAIAATAPLLAPGTINLTVTQSVVGSQTTVAVTVTYPFTFIMPILSPANPSSGLLSDSVTFSY